MEDNDDVFRLERLNKIRDRFESDYMIYHSEYDKEDFISMRNERGYERKEVHEKFRAWLLFSEYDPFFFEE
jgi:hypothetical protein